MKDASVIENDINPPKNREKDERRQCPHCNAPFLSKDKYFLKHVKECEIYSQYIQDPINTGEDLESQEVDKDQTSMPNELSQDQDDWFGHEELQNILKCMRCDERFSSMDLLTKHMVETQHYTTQGKILLILGS